jgi:hypothetical protein
MSNMKCLILGLCLLNGIINLGVGYSQVLYKIINFSLFLLLVGYGVGRVIGI